MMEKPHLVLSVVIFFVVLGVGLILLQKQPEKISLKKTVSDLMGIKKEEDVDYKASFAIFTNGTFRVFTTAMYHNLSDNVFIQADNPNIVHVKKSSLTWNNFFETLPFKLTRDCLTTGTGETFCTGQSGSLKFYLNGILDDEVLGKTIKPSDKVLITFGNKDDTQIQKQLQKVF